MTKVATPPADADGYWHYTYITYHPDTLEWYGGKHSTNRLNDGYSALVDAVQLAPLIPSMPQWLRAALFRRVAGQLGIEPPHRPRKALEGPKYD